MQLTFGLRSCHVKYTKYMYLAEGGGVCLTRIKECAYKHLSPPRRGRGEEEKQLFRPSVKTSQGVGNHMICARGKLTPFNVAGLVRASRKHDDSMCETMNEPGWE